MIRELTNTMLFDLNETMAASLFLEVNYPWEVLGKIHDFILTAGALLPESEFEYRNDNIWIHKSAVIAEGASITGPAIICAGAQVRHNAFIRGDVIVGEGAVAGNATELKNAILFNKAEAPHYNYVGDSILGFHAHMGAGSILSNLRSDKADIVIRCQGETIETGRRKIGGILGDYAEVGCGSVLNPGCIVGKRAMIYPLSMVRGVVPSDTIHKNTGEMIPKE